MGVFLPLHPLIAVGPSTILRPMNAATVSPVSDGSDSGSGEGPELHLVLMSFGMTAVVLNPLGMNANLLKVRPNWCFMVSAWLMR